MSPPDALKCIAKSPLFTSEMYRGPWAASEAEQPRYSRYRPKARVSKCA